MKSVKHWMDKFRNAFRGIRFGVQGQSSFAVHGPIGISVLGLAWWLDCEVWQWCILLLCISHVVAMELMNSAVEYLARGLCSEHNDYVGKALDIASGAVLTSSMIAAIVGLVVLGIQAVNVFT